jgi:hypothetical protein
VDGDGDLDLLVLVLDGAPLLYLNRTDDPGRQLLVSLRAEADDGGTIPAGGLDAFGATLRLEGSAGTVVRQKLSASGFQASSDPRLHVGSPGAVRAASVLWPGGEREDIDPTAFAGGRQVVVVRGRGVVMSHSLESVP